MIRPNHNLIRIGLPLLPLLLLLVPVMVQAQFDYTTNNDGTMTITGYTGPGGKATIPSSITGRRVTSIGDYAFYGSGVTSVGIPTTVTSIGDYAFYLTRLTSVTIPRGVTNIGNYVFNSITSLTNISVRANNPSYRSLTGVLFNKSLTILVQYPIGKAAVSYTITNGVASIGDGAFGSAKLTSVAIPNSVTNIGNGAFNSCTGLTNVLIADGIRNIGDAAFIFCTNLTNLIIPNGVTKIGNYTFHYCTSLSRMTIPSSVITMGDFAFEYCSGLTNLLIGTNLTRIGANAFYSCSGLTSVTIPDSVTSLGYQAFGLCGSLTNLTVGNSVAYIENAAFLYCSSLRRIYFRGNQPRTASAGVFEGDFNNLTAYYLPGTSGWSPWYFGIPAVMLNPPVPAGSLQVTIIPPQAVAGVRWQVDGGIPQPGGATVLGLSVTNHTVSFSILSPWRTPTNLLVFVSANSTLTLTGICSRPVEYQLTYTTNADKTLTVTGYALDLGGAVAIPAKFNDLLVTSIGNSAFSGCASLTNVTIPSGVVNIGDSAFFNCPNLSTITIPNTVTNIGNKAFEFCPSLTEVRIPNSVTSIKQETFAYGDSLTTVTIPNSVTDIGVSAFYYCTSLTNVSIPRSVTNIEESAFYYCTSLANVSISAGVVNIGRSAFWACSMASITIPNSVTNIGDYAFFGCASLSGVYFRGNAPTQNATAFKSGYARVYYLPGTTGWDTTFDGLTTALWRPQIQTSDGSFGLRTNQFGFNINWAGGMVVVVEGTTNLAIPVWSPLQTNTLISDSLYFSDPQWKNYRARLYRLRYP